MALIASVLIFLRKRQPRGLPRRRRQGRHVSEYDCGQMLAQEGGAAGRRSGAA